MPLIVIEHAGLNARGVIDVEALPTYEPRGWVPVGVTSDQHRDPVLTDDEFAAAEATEAARLAALTTPAPTAAAGSTTNKPARAAADKKE